MKKNIALFIVAALFLPALVMPGQAQRSGRTGPHATTERAAIRKDDDADAPSKFKGQLDKKDYLFRREQQIELIRGAKDDPTGQRRARAISQMRQQQLRLEQQRANSLNAPDSPLVDSSRVWTQIGPDPIPNGGVQGGTNRTSGRTVTIAVHPTNPNIVYFGAADGGVYRTLDGGQTFVQLMDTAVTTSIGSIAISPSSPSTIFVGTGEGGFCLDCFFGRGVYRIDNADTDSPALSGPFNLNSSNANVFTGRGISAVAVDPTNPNIVWVTTYSGFSGLSGDTFNVLPTRGLYRSTNALNANPTFDKVSITGTILLTNRPMSDVVIDPGDPNTLLLYAYGTSATPDGGVYRSTNATTATPTFTRTYTTADTTLDVNVRGELTIMRTTGPAPLTGVYLATGEAPAAPANCRIQTGATTFSGGQLHRSTDGGATWASAMGGDGFCSSQCFYDIAVGVDPVNPLHVIIGGNTATSTPCSKSVAQSTDGGTTFSNNGAGVHADQQEVVFAPSDNMTVYEGNDGGIWKSTDGGSTFSSINVKGYYATQFESIALHPTNRNFMIGGTQDNGTEFLSPGFNWRNADGGDGGYSRIDQSAGTDLENVTMYHTYFNQTGNLIGFARIEKTSCATNGQWTFHGKYGGAVDPNTYCDGTTDTFWSTLNLTGENVNFYAPVELGPVGSATDTVHSTVYFGTDQVYRSADRGDTAAEVSQTFTGDIVSTIAISPQNDNVRLAGTDFGKVWGTTTGANPMTDFTPAGGPAKYVARVMIDPNNVNTAYVTYDGYGVAAGQHVWKTTNLTTGGPTWAASGNGIPDVPVNDLVVDPANSSNLFAATDIGVYNSTDGGANWAPYNTGLPVVPVFEVEIQNPNRVLRIGTHGRGIWEIKLKNVAAKISDFNGDGRTDLAVQRQTDGNWYIFNSTLSITIPNTTTQVNFPGTSGDKLVPGDYDGDGKTDFGIFRPSDATWRVKLSGGGADLLIPFGLGSDLPAQGDYDGDGKTDIAVWRPSNGTWYIRNSDGSVNGIQWGASGDKPVQGDYDGDMKNDLAVFRPADGTWYILKSSSNYSTFSSQQWGVNTDKVVPADYDGDAKTDIAVWRPGDGTWYVLRSGDGTFTSTPFGVTTDTPVPGDYDGDGMADIAVWRPSTGQWYVLKSSNQPLTGMQWGGAGDIPVPSAYVPQQ